MSNSCEKCPSPSLASQSGIRKPPSTAPTIMRKYQQLALVLITVISLCAFLFYKHEYDRLRYTIEYLDTFGVSSQEGVLTPICRFSTSNKLTTSPSSWIKIESDLFAFTSFWDVGNGIETPRIHTIGVVKKSDDVSAADLKALFLYEDGNGEKATCQLEMVPERTHAYKQKMRGELYIVNIICTTDDITNRNVPVLIQFQVGSNELSPPVYVQENESWKSVANISAMCMFASGFPSSTIHILESVALHNSMGFEKFIFYGPLLTSISRKILDQYGEESGIFYEEKNYILPIELKLNEDQIRKTIELDCIYRHRDTYENVIVLKTNELMMPRTKTSLTNMISSLSIAGAKMQSSICEFHFSTMRVCLDSDHMQPKHLYIASQLRALESSGERGVAILRPHLISSPMETELNNQHVPPAAAVVLSIDKCLSNSKNEHKDTDHIPINIRFVDLVEKHLLYRKWKIYS